MFRAILRGGGTDGNLALTMQHSLATALFTSAFLFHSVIIATQQGGMLTPDTITTRGGR